jgi:hypothetical protein
MDRVINIWTFQAAISRRLAQWSAVSFALGAAMALGRAFWRAVGGQFMGWAVVNVAIAFFGSRAADARYHTLPNPEAPAVQAEEARKLSRLLWINAGLDIIYMAAGRWLMRGDKPARRGMGLGIILQGAFLFIFDVYHALMLDEGRQHEQHTDQSV